MSWPLPQVASTYSPPGASRAVKNAWQSCTADRSGTRRRTSWLPGAEHDVHSTADGSVPALRAALEALRPGGVLAAVLYSGKVIGDAEKQAALAFFKALPLTRYTVLVCEFANWAQTAPLPCFVIKK